MDLNVRAKTIKILEENMGVNPHHFGLANGFLDMTPKANITKENTDKLDLIKIYNWP